jgi:hypothetical protein
MLESKNKDFIFSLVLGALGVYVVYEGFGVYWNAARPPFNITTFNISPGFLPVLLGFVLIFLSIILFVQSLRGAGGAAKALKNQGRDISKWMRGLSKNRDILNMAAGTLIMGIYVFFMIKNLPYWAASVIFIFGLLLFLRAGKIWTILLIALVSTGCVILFFQIIFRTSLP